MHHNLLYQLTHDQPRTRDPFGYMTPQPLVRSVVLQRMCTRIRVWPVQYYTAMQAPVWTASVLWSNVIGMRVLHSDYTWADSIYYTTTYSKVSVKSSSGAFHCQNVCQCLCLCFNLCSNLPPGQFYVITICIAWLKIFDTELAHWVRSTLSFKTQVWTNTEPLIKCRFESQRNTWTPRITPYKFVYTISMRRLEQTSH